MKFTKFRAGATGGDRVLRGLVDTSSRSPSLGELTVIGATTQDEYCNNYLKNALARRFNVKSRSMLLQIIHIKFQGIHPTILQSALQTA